MHKNYRLLIILLLITILSIALNLSSGIKNSSGFRSDLFQVFDTAMISAIKISGIEDVIIERKANRPWQINNKFEINMNLKKVLLAVLNQVEIRRPVSKIQQAEIAVNLRNSIQVSVHTDSEVKEFFVGGNAARTQSYFMMKNEGQPYIVEIPGYRNYISGLFELTEQQWRDRKLFYTTWRSLQTLAVIYPGNPSKNVNIYFEEDFFRIDRVNRLDTLSLMTYLSRFELFEANEFIPNGFLATYDSLAKTNPFAVIELKEINESKNQRLQVFPKLNDDNYILTLNKDNELSLVDFNRIKTLLAQPEDFLR